MLMVVYEPLILVGAVGGLIESLRRRSAFYLFLTYLAVAVLILFSLAGEKFPWLALCSLLPITVLAGFYYADRWTQFSSGTKVIVILLLAFTLLNAVRLNFLHPADTNELAVYVQTPDKFQSDVVGSVVRDCEDRGVDCVLIDQQITWPLSWTFKSSSSLFYAESLEVKDATQYIFAAPENSDKTKIPEGWQKRTATLRDWWVPDKCNLIKNPQCYGRFVSYFLFRNTWNAKGGYDIYLYHKFQ
jgi:predicted membrane-bound mannosyltransferase